ncbi:MAG TPA: hypothetical protein VF189_00800 [Patescibacteria group bacterium]
MENKASEKTSVFHSFKDVKSTFLTGKVLVVLVIFVAAGIFTGYYLSHQGVTTPGQASPASSNSIQKGAVYGTNDTSTFKDTAEGTVANGGIDGEGQYHLVRPGGDSQNVYMTSSLVDLSLFIGKKVKVWGQTQAAQKAGWLMDVGRVEVE